MKRDSLDIAAPGGVDDEPRSRPRRRLLKGGIVAAPAVFTMRQSYAAIGSAAACVERNVQEFREGKPAAISGTAVDSWVRVPWIYFELAPEFAEASPAYFLAPTAEVRSQIVDGPVDGEYYLTDAQGVAFSPLKTVRLTLAPLIPAQSASTTAPEGASSCAGEMASPAGSVASAYETETAPVRGKPGRSVRGLDGRGSDRFIDPKRRGEDRADPRDRGRGGTVSSPSIAGAVTDPCAGGSVGGTTTATTGATDRRYRGTGRPPHGMGDRIRGADTGIAPLGAGSSWTTDSSSAQAPRSRNDVVPGGGKSRRTEIADASDAGSFAGSRTRDARDGGRVPRDRRQQEGTLTSPLPVDVPATPSSETFAPAPVAPAVQATAHMYAIEGVATTLFQLVAQRDTNILRLYDGVSGAPATPLAVGDSATYVALTGSCDASVNPNGGMG